MTALVSRGDYLHKDQVEQCVFVYFFVLFVYVTVCLFPGPTQYISYVHGTI